MYLLTSELIYKLTLSPNNELFSDIFFFISPQLFKKNYQHFTFQVNINQQYKEQWKKNIVEHEFIKYCLSKIKKRL